MRKSTMEKLYAHGKNADNYLSLRISKGDLPVGTEVVVMVRDEKTGDLRPLTTKGKHSVRAFAQNSRFYQRVMQDGHIFNPYIHRRYIAAQFRRLLQQYGYYGIKDSIARSFSWDYAIGILRKEVHTLSNLVNHDSKGFNERSRFFTMENCFKILRDYAADVCRHIDTCVSNSRGDRVYIPGYGCVERANVRPMKYRFNSFAEEVGRCRNYQQLDQLMQRFEWLELPKGIVLPTSFTEPFIEEGAFYTLKHHMMFEGLLMWDCSQQKSLDKLLNHKGRYLDLYQSLMK